ncbi:MAG: DUF3800 domain-containing protein [Phycicoccus sp.]
MSRVFMYADETGDLGYDSAAAYFGLGTATFAGDHPKELWQGLDLRVRLEQRGVRLQRGLHAKNDSASTRGQMFDVIADQPFRFDSTLLLKANAYPRVRAEGPVRLYQMALYLHVKEIVLQVSRPGDEVFFIAGHLQTNAKRDAIYEAVRRVCAQLSDDREMVPCVWDAPSSWGIQVADYCLWSVQRALLGKPNPWHARCVEPKVASTFLPWGRA